MSQSMTPRPVMPKPFALPLGLVPDGLHSALMSRILNRVFAAEIADGELDFLEGYTVCIRVSDARMSYGLRLEEGRFSQAATEGADLTIEGTAYDYMLLVSDREDADTLFFQRRLSMGGSTELGVHLKNFLAGVDLEALPLPKQVRPALDRFVSLYERFA